MVVSEKNEGFSVGIVHERKITSPIAAIVAVPPRLLMFKMALLLPLMNAEGLAAALKNKVRPVPARAHGSLGAPSHDAAAQALSKDQCPLPLCCDGHPVP